MSIIRAGAATIAILAMPASIALSQASKSIRGEADVAH